MPAAGVEPSALTMSTARWATSSRLPASITPMVSMKATRARRMTSGGTFLRSKPATYSAITCASFLPPGTGSAGLAAGAGWASAREAPSTAAALAPRSRRRSMEIFLVMSRSCISASSLRQVEIPDPVVRRRAEPHAAFVVAEVVAHGIFRARDRVLGHLAGLRVEPAHHVHVFRGVPDVTIRIDAERVGRRLRPGQRELLEGLGLRIEAADLAGVEFGEPHDAVPVDHDAARPRALRRDRVLGHLASLEVGLADLAVGQELGEPGIAVGIEIDAVRGRHLREVGEFFRLRIEHGERPG